MKLTNSQLMAAREMGEAIARFLIAMQDGWQERSLPRPKPEKTVTSSGESNELVSAWKAAEILCLSRSKVYGLMETGHLPYVKIGKSRRVRRQDIKKLIEDSLVSRSDS